MSDPNNLEGPPPTTEERAAMARELDAVAPTPADKFRLMLGQRPTPRTDDYKYHAEDGGWIAAPNNGGDIGGLPEIADELNRLARELAEAMEEGEEQARLLGMSGEREAGLLGEIERLKREIFEVRDENRCRAALAELEGGTDE